MPEIIAQMSKPILAYLKSTRPLLLRNSKQERRSFESSLAKVWRKPLSSLEMLVEISREAGADFNHQFRNKAQEECEYVFEVLTRLHARACQVSSEILCLLSSGYADGAHARWRTLHEIAVIGWFIKSAGNEVAEKYLLHDVIESYKAARLYQDHFAKLGYEPMSGEELEEINSTRDRLLLRFGQAYKGDYGWAAPLGNKMNPTFKDIEAEVALHHFRPLYKLASHNVHANPKGVLFRLGLYPEKKEILLAGPSNTGLADPGHGTAISLSHITIALLTFKPNLDRLVICEVLMSLGKEIGDQFLVTQKSLEGKSDRHKREVVYL